MNGHYFIFVYVLRWEYDYSLINVEMYQKLATVEQTSKAFFEDDGRLVLVIFVVLRSLNGQRLER
jgi:hypothetical protein